MVRRERSPENTAETREAGVAGPRAVLASDTGPVCPSLCKPTGNLACVFDSCNTKKPPTTSWLLCCFFITLLTVLMSLSASRSFLSPQDHVLLISIIIASDPVQGILQVPINV